MHSALDEHLYEINYITFRPMVFEMCRFLKVKQRAMRFQFYTEITANNSSTRIWSVLDA
jgi:hypothetical protein